LNLKCHFTFILGQSSDLDFGLRFFYRLGLDEVRIQNLPQDAGTCRPITIQTSVGVLGIFTAADRAGFHAYWLCVRFSPIGHIIGFDFQIVPGSLVSRVLILFGLESHVCLSGGFGGLQCGFQI
jgi:hypothetical protein